MEEHVTLGAIAVLLLGVHVVFAVYLYRSLLAKRDRTERVGETASGIDSTPDSSVAASDVESSAGDRANTRSALPCPTCGTPNDPSYQFCRRCVSDLSTNSTTPHNAVDRSSS